jgi:hypothetical protein
MDPKYQLGAFKLSLNKELLKSTIPVIFYSWNLYPGRRQSEFRIYVIDDKYAFIFFICYSKYFRFVQVSTGHWDTLASRLAILPLIYATFA